MKFMDVCKLGFVQTDLEAAIQRRIERMGPGYDEHQAEHDLASWYQEMLRGERESAPGDHTRLARFVVAHEPEYVWVACLTAARRTRDATMMEGQITFGDRLNTALDITFGDRLNTALDEYSMRMIKDHLETTARDLNRALLPMLELYDDRVVVQTAARRGLAVAERLLLLAQGRSASGDSGA